MEALKGLNEETAGRFLTMKREESDLSLEIVADSLGLTTKTVERWEKGKGKIIKKHFDGIKKAYRLTKDESAKLWNLMLLEKTRKPHGLGLEGEIRVGGGSDLIIVQKIFYRYTLLPKERRDHLLRMMSAYEIACETKQKD